VEHIAFGASHFLSHSHTERVAEVTNHLVGRHPAPLAGASCVNMMESVKQLGFILRIVEAFQVSV